MYQLSAIKPLFSVYNNSGDEEGVERKTIFGRVVYPASQCHPTDPQFLDLQRRRISKSGLKDTPLY